MKWLDLAISVASLVVVVLLAGWAENLGGDPIVQFCVYGMVVVFVVTDVLHIATIITPHRFHKEDTDTRDGRNL